MRDDDADHEVVALSGRGSSEAQRLCPSLSTAPTQPEAGLAFSWLAMLAGGRPGTAGSFQLSAFGLVCLLAFGRADWHLDGSDTCPLVKLDAYLYAVNMACCTGADGENLCENNGTPRGCHLDCATTFVPFYDACHTLLESYFDANDQHEDRSVAHIRGFFNTCISGTMGVQARDAIVEMGGCDENVDVCRVPKEIKLVSDQARSSPTKLVRCPITGRDVGIVQDVNETALAQPYFVAPPAAPVGGFGRRMQMGYGAGGDNICQFSTWDVRLAECNSACCDPLDAEDTCDQSRHGGRPLTCDFECAVVWEKFYAECASIITIVFAAQHEVLRHFQVLTETCDALPVMPMLRAIQTAVTSCECTPVPALVKTGNLSCSPDKSPYWWNPLKVVPVTLPPAPNVWLQSPEEAACPLSQFEGRLDAVNQACCHSSAGEVCEPIGPPQSCSLDCAVELIPFYRDCRSTIDKTMDAGSDGNEHEDGAADEWAVAVDTCMSMDVKLPGGNPAVRLSELVAAGCTVDTSRVVKNVSAVVAPPPPPPPHRPPPPPAPPTACGTFEMSLYTTCVADCTACLAHTMNTTRVMVAQCTLPTGGTAAASLQSLCVSSGGSSSGGGSGGGGSGGHRRQLQLGQLVNNAVDQGTCSFTMLNTWLNAVDAACCADAGACSGGVPQQCGIQCSTHWLQLSYHCNSLFHMVFQQDVLQAFEGLTNACKSLPIGPMFHAIHDAVCGCQSPTNVTYVNMVNTTRKVVQALPMETTCAEQGMLISVLPPVPALTNACFV